MSFAEAACNILESYRFQFSLSGELPSRLTYATLYWGRYFYAKRVKAVGGYFTAHRDALEFLARRGLTQRQIVVRLPNGLRLKLDCLTCHMILREILQDRIYDTDGINDFSPRPGGVVFDIGAQQGIYSSLAALKIGNEGKVVSVEPDPINFELLSQNIADNRLRQIQLVRAAISNHTGFSQFYRSGYNTGAHSLILPSEGFETSERVRVTTLDALSEELGLFPDLLKIDAEGSALAVIEGGIAMIRKSRPRIVLEADSPEDSQRLQEKLSPLGYRLSSRGNNLFAWPDKGDRN